MARDYRVYAYCEVSLDVNRGNQTFILVAQCTFVCMARYAGVYLRIPPMLKLLSQTGLCLQTDNMSLGSTNKLLTY